MRYLTFFAIALFCQMSISAQDAPEIYIQVDYMKTPSNLHDDYIQMEKMIFKPIHQERIRQEEIVAWYLYEVQYPSGEDTEYDFVTLTFYANFSLMDEGGMSFEEVTAKVHPDMTMMEVESSAANSRKLVKSEVVKTVVQYPELAGPPSKSLLVDYMKVDPLNQPLYMRMETEIWYPMHMERHKRGHIQSWGLHELVFPGGLNYPYTHATSTGFANWDKIKDSWPEDLWQDVHPNASQEALEKRAHETRDLVSTQIWRLVDHTRLKKDGTVE